jgi:hypothetical protein
VLGINYAATVWRANSELSQPDVGYKLSLRCVRKHAIGSHTPSHGLIAGPSFGEVKPSEERAFHSCHCDPTFLVRLVKGDGVRYGRHWPS